LKGSKGAEGKNRSFPNKFSGGEKEKSYGEALDGVGKMWYNIR
jgi:hypothetical protein